MMDWEAGLIIRIHAGTLRLCKMTKNGLIIFLCMMSESAWALSTLPVKEVADNIYVHFGVNELPDRKNHGAIANIGFIVGDHCIAVIDTGGNPEQGRKLYKTIKGITAVPVCYVINTHVHPDHVNGNAAFNQSGVKFIGHYKLARAMRTRASFYIDRAEEQLAINLSQVDIVVPDIKVSKQMQLELGNRKLILTAHPTAHTDNDLSIVDEKTNTLWLSDLLFLEHIPVIDGSIKGWITELEVLAKKPFKQVVPGHGPLVKNWPKAVIPTLSYLKLLTKEIREKIKQGIYLEEAVNTVGLSEKNKWLLFDQFHKKNVTSSFAELEWED